MPSVLLIGLRPDTVDFSDPDLPPGMTADKIQAGVNGAMKAMRDKGWTGDFCGIAPDDTAEADIARSLKARPWDCVVVGGGVRIPKALLEVFERVVTAVHKGAPNAAIAFNTNPENTPDAAARWV